MQSTAVSNVAGDYPKRIQPAVVPNTRFGPPYTGDAAHYRAFDPTTAVPSISTHYYQIDWDEPRGVPRAALDSYDALSKLVRLPQMEMSCDAGGLYGCYQRNGFIVMLNFLQRSNRVSIWTRAGQFELQGDGVTPKGMADILSYRGLTLDDDAIVG